MDIQAITQRVEEENLVLRQIMAEMEKVVVGQRNLVERMLIGLLCDGHLLLEGLPGLAKTTAVKTLAATINTTFQRIQFTPDLLPADILGTQIYRPDSGTFEIKQGPIFNNIILADEINRAPAKVQSALLEAMQERQVSIGEKSHPMDDPFLVLATQNPIEQEGTYPLPEAQVDRFMLKVILDYPNKEEELEIVRRMAVTNGETKIKAVVTPAQLKRARSVVNDVYVDEKIHQYIVDLVFATRAPQDYGLKDAEELIAYGASPRASIYLTMASKAKAFIQGRGYVTPEDVRDILWDVLRHRIILTFEAEAEEVTAENIIQRIVDTVEVP